MVLNAECDLASHLTQNNAKFPSDRPILLIPGPIKSLNKELRHSGDKQGTHRNFGI